LSEGGTKRNKPLSELLTGDRSGEALTEWLGSLRAGREKLAQRGVANKKLAMRAFDAGLELLPALAARESKRR